MDKYKFFAMQINGNDALIVCTPEEALEEIASHIEICDSDDYGISPISGIWELIRRMGAFEGYDDDWMEVVLDTVTNMVADAKARMQEEEEKREKLAREIEASRKAQQLANADDDSEAEEV